MRLPKLAHMRILLLPNVVEGGRLWGAHDEKTDMTIVIMMMKFFYDYCTGGELGSSANWVALLIIIVVSSLSSPSCSMSIAH